jgi:hypothetical protein
VSARHFIGTRTSVSHQRASKPYLGIGNPDLTRPSEPLLTEAKAVPEFNQSSLSDLPALPETADELTAVQRLLGASPQQVLVASKATEEMLRSEDLGKYDVIHFATHGLLKGDILGLSEPALVLTPGTPSDSFDDGVLTASEITRLSLNARLIVLSACNTAKVDTGAVNIGATDLQAAFSVAGSPTLLASLWTVESSSARDLIIGFFQAWRGQEQKSASEALALATRNYLFKADLAHQNPRFWAAFVVLGNGGKVPAGTSTTLAGFGNFMPMNNAVGEVIDAKSFGGSVVVSMQGDWDGRTMASIIKNGWIANDDKSVQSHEIGAGGLIVANNALYTTGYRISDHPIPVIRKITNGGKVEWEKRFDDLIDYTFSDGGYFDGHLFLVAQPNSENRSKLPQIAVLKIDLEGREIGRGTVAPPYSNLLVGKRSFLSKTANGVSLMVNSQEISAMDQTKRERFGLPTWCLGKLTTIMYTIDLGSMGITKIGTIPDFQTFSAEQIGSRTFVGGMKRSACSDSGAATVYEVT